MQSFCEFIRAMRPNRPTPVLGMKSGKNDAGHVLDENGGEVFLSGMRNKSFADRLKEAIGDETVRGFSRKCGLSEATLRDYLKGASYPTIDRLQKIAVSADKAMAWFIGEPLTLHEAPSAYAVEHVIAEQFAMIPCYRGQVPAWQGVVLSQSELEQFGHVALSRTWLSLRGFDVTQLAIIWCKGDSMEPTIRNNDTLVVHLGRTRLVDGHIYVVRDAELLWVKRVQVRHDAWVLISDNAIYPPITIKKHEQHTFEVIGQVVHISHDVGE